MMKKQTLAVLMACAAIVAALTGCSTEATEAIPETIVAAETTTALETTLEETVTVGISTETPGVSSGMTPRVGSLKGPASTEPVSLTNQAPRDEAKDDYKFTMVIMADELLTKAISGDLDITLVLVNVVNILYNKTNHGASVTDINTLGVLHVVLSDESIQSVADLKGEILYMAGKGIIPDYVLQYLLSENGLTTDDVTIEYKSKATRIAAVLKEQEGAIGLLPQPFTTVAIAQNESLKVAPDLTKEWEVIQGETGGSLVTDVTICHSELFADSAGVEAIDVFLVGYKASAMFTIDNVAGTVDLVAAAGTIEKAPVAAKAIPYYSIIFVDGGMIKSILDGYLTMLFDQDPASMDGALPDDAPYYTP